VNIPHLSPLLKGVSCLPFPKRTDNNAAKKIHFIKELRERLIPAIRFAIAFFAGGSPPAALFKDQCIRMAVLKATPFA
jgi:hypothetical protein